MLVLAFVLRLLVLREMAALPFFDQPVGDSAAHLKRAAAIAAGSWLPAQPFYYCSIFYPYFLALVLGPLHGTLFTVGLIQILAGVTVVALLALVTRAAYGATAGLATGLLAALHGPSAFFETDVLGVAGGQLALALGLAAGVAWYLRSGHGRTASAAWLAAAGVAFGLAIVERANLLLLLPAVGAWVFGLAARGRRVRALVALAAGAAIPLGLVLTLNVAGSGQWVPLTTSGGINLSLGFHDGATGTYDEPWERESPEFSARHPEPETAMTAWASSRTGRALDTRQASAYWTRQALEWIGAHPGESLRLVVRKAALMLNDAEIANHLDFVFIREHVPALRLMPVGFALVLMGAVFGAGWTLLSGPRRAITILMLLAATAAFASVLPFTVADRYRAPMLPPLLVLAGAGVAAGIGFATDPARRRVRGAWLPLVAGVLVFAVARIPLARPERARDWWMFAEAWETKGNLPAAVAAYETALGETPAQPPGEAGDRAELLNNLGEAYRRMGDRERAIACLRRAITAESRLAYPHKNLGMLLVADGHRDEALRELVEADRLAPDDPQVLGAIGALEAERGDRAAADRAFARAKALAPTDPGLERLIREYTPHE